MEKLTEDFIRAIKKADDNPRETAINFMMNYTGSPRESYSIDSLYRIVKDFFLDYLKTGNAWECMWYFFESRKTELYLSPNCCKCNRELQTLDLDIECMLGALSMVRVVKDGKITNGFTRKVFGTLERRKNE